MFTDSALMSPHFDEEAYLRYALHASNRQAEQNRLTSCAKAVREEVHKILSQNAEDMLQQVTATCRAQREVAAVRQATSSLMGSTSRLRHAIQEPHRVINMNITKLHNTNTALNALRSTLKFIGLTKRLRGQLPHDLARAARTLRELEELLQTSNIKGIEVVDARMGVVERAAVTIRTEAYDMLRRGSVNDTSDVATSLQCFFTLGNLSRVLGTFMAEQKREVIRSLMRDLDLQTMNDEISHGNGSTTSDINARTREVVFSHLNSAFASTVRHTQVVVAVWRVLVKKVDHITHTPYLSAVESPTSALGDYWHIVTEKLYERLQGVQKRPNFLAVLAGDVLHYRSLLENFLGNMGEFLEVLGRLMEMDTISLKRTCGSSLSSNISPAMAVAAASEQLKRVWLSQVTQGVYERFAAHMTDRHRERLHHILSKLPSIFPTAGGRSTVNVVVDLQRPQVPAASYALDTRGYTMLATQDLTTYRQDPHALCIILKCVFQSLDAFIQPITEATSNWPLPPLPSVSGDATTLQMFHICVSNACALLGNDLEVLFASLPEGGNLFARDCVAGRWSSGKTCGEEQKADKNENFDDVKQSIVEQHHQILELTKKCKLMSGQIVESFFKSVTVLLLDSVSMCVAGSLEQEAAGLGQMHSQMQHFMSHFYFLFDPQTPTMDEHARRLTDGLLARLIVSVVLVYPFSTDAGQHVLSCLQQITHVVLSLGALSSRGTVGRSTLSLKALIHQLTMWYSLSEDLSGKSVKEWHTAFATFPLVVARLLLLQRILLPSRTVKEPCTEMGLSLGGFVEVVETILLEQLHVDDRQPRSADDAKSRSSAMMRLGDVMRAVETCFCRATAVSCEEDTTREPTVCWLGQLWSLLKD